MRPLQRRMNLKFYRPIKRTLNIHEDAFKSSFNSIRDDGRMNFIKAWEIPMASSLKTRINTSLSRMPGEIVPCARPKVNFRPNALRKIKLSFKPYGRA